MTHYAYRERRDDLRLEFDYVVIGSGAGGATVAHQLAGGGAEVCVIEAGPWRMAADYPQSTYGALRDLFDDWGATVTRGRALWPVVQGSGVGGSTVINSAIAVRTPADIFTSWQRDHGVGGPAMAEAVWAHQDALERELCASPTPAATTGRSNTLAQQGADSLGYTSGPTTRFVKDCIGSGQCLQGCGSERKQSLNVTLMPAFLQLGGTVLSCAPVERVLLDGTAATGVTGRFRHPHTRRMGASFAVSARKAVIVAASATHSPALLQRSGVRSPALGEHFRAHPGTGIFGVYDDPVDMNVGATQGWASMAFRDAPGFKLETLAVPPELVAGRVKGGGTELVRRLARYRHFAMWVMAVRAESTGTVRNGWGGRPVVNYTLDAADMSRMRAGALMVARTHFAAGAARVVPGVTGLPYDLGPDDLSLLEEAPLDPRAWTGILSHLFGGCVMGTDVARSVVDGRGRVHGYQRLVVADASAIPSNLGVNPQLTLMALARLRADELLG